MRPVVTTTPTVVVIAGVVILVAFLLAAATGIVLASPEQAAVLVPILIAFVAPTTVGLMALARADRSVDVAHEARDTAVENTTSIQKVSEQVDGRMSEVLRLLQTTAGSQVAKDDAARVARNTTTSGQGQDARRAAEDAQVTHTASDLAATRAHEDAASPPDEEPPAAAPVRRKP